MRPLLPSSSAGLALALLVLKLVTVWETFGTTGVAGLLVLTLTKRGWAWGAAPWRIQGPAVVEQGKWIFP